MKLNLRQKATSIMEVEEKSQDQAPMETKSIKNLVSHIHFLQLPICLSRSILILYFAETKNFSRVLQFISQEENQTLIPRHRHTSFTPAENDDRSSVLPRSSFLVNFQWNELLLNR